jgi:hypothetical protein
VRRWPLTRERWVTNSAVLLAGTLAVSVARVLINPLLAVLLDQPAAPAFSTTRVLGGLGAFLAVVGMLHALHFYRQMREREREATELARSLTEAQLATSEARLASLRADSPSCCAARCARPRMRSMRCVTSWRSSTSTST